MKSKLTFALTLTLLLVLHGCKEKQVETVVQEEVKIDLINDDFPEAEAEIMAAMEELTETIKNGDVDKLIAFHAYGPKFTEFKGGEKRVGSKENEEYERGIFENVTEVVKFNYDDLKIAVFGDVANVTFHSDFHLKFEDGEAIVNEQITLLMVKTEAGWKCVHEHHSPLIMEEN
jgi:ketosteroid isomerase-like protein